MEMTLSNAKTLVASASKDVWNAICYDICAASETGNVPADCVVDAVLNAYFVYADEESKDAAKLLMADSNPTAMADAVGSAFDGDYCF